MNSLLIALLLFNIPITKISFIGNKSIAGNVLANEIVLKTGDEYDEAVLVYNLERMSRLYNNAGFFSAQIKPKVEGTDQAVEITFFIDEGTRPRIKKIIVEDSEIKKLLEIKINNYFFKDKIITSEKKIKSHYQDRGYPFCDVSSKILPDSGILVFEVVKGTKSYIGDLEVKGLKSCSKGVVLREIELKTGDLFVQSKLYKSQKRIYSLGFFSTVSVEIVRHESDTVDISFTARELKSRLLNFGLGFAIPLNFLISVGLEELNLFNIGHRILISPSFRINIHGDWESKIEGKYTIPSLTPARLSFSLLPFYWFEDKKEFRRITRGVESGVAKVLNDYIELNVAHKYKLVDLTQKITLPDTIKGVTNSIRCQLIFDYRDDFFNPRKGVYLVPTVEYGGGLFGGDNDFIRLEIEERLFYPLLGNTIAQRLRLGVIHPTDGLAVYEKYYLGGQYSLRGYPERSIGPDSLGTERYGEILANLNIEYRIMLPLNLGVVGFFDLGYLDNDFDLNHRDYIKASAGFGLRYYTIIGPIRGDIGFPLTKEAPEIYFGIYHVF